MPTQTFSQWKYVREIAISQCNQDYFLARVTIYAGGEDHEMNWGIGWAIGINPLYHRSDYGDIRFTDEHGTELKYVLEESSENSAWYRVEFTRATTQNRLRIYYGNPNAESKSDSDLYLNDDCNVDDGKWALTGSMAWGSQYAQSGAGGYGTPDGESGTATRLIEVRENETLYFHARRNGGEWPSRVTIDNKVVQCVTTSGAWQQFSVDLSSYTPGVHALKFWAFWNTSPSSEPSDLSFDNVFIDQSGITTSPEFILSNDYVNPVYSGLTYFIPPPTTLEFGGEVTLEIIGDAAPARPVGAGSFELSIPASRSVIKVSGFAALEDSSSCTFAPYDLPRSVHSQFKYLTRIDWTPCTKSSAHILIKIHRTTGMNRAEAADDGAMVWHIYAGSRCSRDFSDFRFTDALGLDLDHYLWYMSDDHSEAQFVVDLNGTDSSGQLLVYYGSHWNVPSVALPIPEDGIPVMWGCEANDQSLDFPSDTRLISAATGQYHSVGIMTDGTVIGWGDDGDPERPPEGLKAISVAAGEDHSLALKPDGTVVGWGDDYYGETIPPAGLTDVIEIETGNNFAIAMQEDGTTVAWGYENYVPDLMPAGLKVKAMSAPVDEKYVLAVKLDGSLIGWGDKPHVIGEYVPSGTDYTQVAAGNCHGAALKEDGTVVAWGGYDSDVTFTPPAGLDEVIQISAGKAHTAALRRDGTVVAWGKDHEGQLDVIDGTRAIFIAGGFRNTIAILPFGLFTSDSPGIAVSKDGVNPNYAGINTFFPMGMRAYLYGAGEFRAEGETVVTQMSGAGGVSAIAGPIGVIVAGVLAEAEMTQVSAMDIAQTPFPGIITLMTDTDVGTLSEIAGTGGTSAPPAEPEIHTDEYTLTAMSVSRTAQDAMWGCSGIINGDVTPEPGKNFRIIRPDHNGIDRLIFFGSVPKKECIQKVAENKSSLDGFDQSYYLTRQYLPDGDTTYPAEFWTGTEEIITNWLGGSDWRTVSGIKPYRIWDPGIRGRVFVDKDWSFNPDSSKLDAIGELCEYYGMVFMVKWHEISGELTPCGYLVHEEDLDDSSFGLDLPSTVTFTSPDPYVMDGISIEQSSDEKYNRVIVRSSAPDGSQYASIRETPALTAKDELPIEYQESRADLPQSADHGAWCVERADALYDYYTKYIYSYSLTLLNRVDLELYQKIILNGFSPIPDHTEMRIIAIEYALAVTHTEVRITVTPADALMGLRKLQRACESDSVTETQNIIRSEVNKQPKAEIGTVISVDSYEATVELERSSGSRVKGRIA